MFRFFRKKQMMNQPTGCPEIIQKSLELELESPSRDPMHNRRGNATSVFLAERFPQESTGNVGMDYGNATSAWAEI